MHIYLSIITLISLKAYDFSPKVHAENNDIITATLSLVEQRYSNLNTPPISNKTSAITGISFLATSLAEVQKDQ